MTVPRCTLTVHTGKLTQRNEDKSRCRLFDLVRWAFFLQRRFRTINDVNNSPSRTTGATFRTTLNGVSANAQNLTRQGRPYLCEPTCYIVSAPSECFLLVQKKRGYSVEFDVTVSKLVEKSRPTASCNICLHFCTMQ